MTYNPTESNSYEIELTWKASHIGHNLFSWREQGVLQVASCHRDTVQIISLSEDSKDNSDYFSKEEPLPKVKGVSMRESALSDASCTVLQAKVVEIESQLILVIINENNIQFHDVVQNIVLYTFIPQSRIACDLISFESPPTSVSPVSASDDEEARIRVTNSFIEPFARGIGHLKFFIFVGLSDGCLLVMSRLEDGCITYEDTICTNYDGIGDEQGSRSKKATGRAITDISSDKQSIVVSGDSSGAVTVYEPDGEEILRVVMQFEGFNQFPCTGVRVCDNNIVATYGSGHMRVFGIIQKRLLSEVHAHLSWINCIDVIHLKGDDYFVLTGSDDSVIRLWKVSHTYPWIRHENHYILKNRMVTGVAFLPSQELDSLRFAASAFDFDKLTLFE